MTGTELLWRLLGTVLKKNDKGQIDLTERQLEQFERFDFAVLAVRWEGGKPRQARIIHDALEAAPDGWELIPLSEIERGQIDYGIAMTAPPPPIDIASRARRPMFVASDRLVEVEPDREPPF